MRGWIQAAQTEPCYAERKYARHVRARGVRLLGVNIIKPNLQHEHQFYSSWVAFLLEFLHYIHISASLSTLETLIPLLVGRAEANQPTNSERSYPPRRMVGGMHEW